MKYSRRFAKSCLFSSISNRSHHKSIKSLRTVVTGTNFMRKKHHQRNRNRLLVHHKSSTKSPSSFIMSNNKDSSNLSTENNTNIISSVDSILSNISFDNVSNILTISRMGSIFYCLEDLYSKAFSSLCTLDEFVNFLSKSDVIFIKQVTLLEKVSIEQELPSLKKLNDNRYRLISINSSDYLLKLKQLLLTYSDLSSKILRSIQFRFHGFSLNYR